ncbi:MAG: AMP-binding protein, partial [Deltaproteobacteria bacterium]|nr:AMP-binding protein [Deltaproteobacteria bacterium]
MNRWLTVADILRVNAIKFPDKEGVADLNRSLTFKEFNERCCRLANALGDLGLKKGDRIAMLAYNCLEWMEFYGACAKGGFVAVPIMFRLTPTEYTYILNNAEAAAIIVEKPFAADVMDAKPDFETIKRNGYIYFGEGEAPEGYTHLESLIASGSPEEPETKVYDEDTWIIMYTSGTT